VLDRLDSQMTISDILQDSETCTLSLKWSQS